MQPSTFHRGVTPVRTFKRLAGDGTALALGFYFAYLIRFEFAIPEEQLLYMLRLLPLVLTLKLLFLYRFRQFHSLPDYFGVSELVSLSCAIGSATLCLSGARWMAGFPQT